MTLGAAGSTAANTLRGLTRFLTKTTSTTFSDTDIDALLNQHYHQFVNEIINVSDEIDFNVETESITFTAGTRTYTITGKILKIKKMQVTYDGSAWKECNITFDPKETDVPFNDAGSSSNDDVDAYFSKENPQVYLYVSNETYKFDIYPEIGDSETTQTNGIKIWKILEITELSGTSDEPKIAEAYQKYLSYGAAKEYFVRKGLYSKVYEMEKLMLDIFNKAIRFYSKRTTDDVLKMKYGGSDYA